LGGYRHELAGTNLLVFMLFGLAMFDGVVLRVFAEPLLLLGLSAVAFTVALGSIGAAMIVLRAMGADEAFMTGFATGHLGDAVPEDHLVRRIDTSLDLSWLRSELASHYSSMGRPSIDPELMIRMLVVGYVFAIRSERLICREVQVNLAYRWFCKLGIEDAIPDHSAFSRARNERFRDGDVFRRLFERVVEACIAAGLVGGEAFAVDASLIQADANKQRSIAGQDWRRDRDP